MSKPHQVPAMFPNRMVLALMLIVSALPKVLLDVLLAPIKVIILPQSS
jgi:hypothetical protein